MPRMYSAPITGPAIEPRPPITAVATTRIDCSGVNAWVGVTVSCAVMSSVPASAAMPPDSANDMILIRLGDTVDAAAMSWLSRTAIIERPIPVRLRRETTSVVTMSTPRQR